MELDFVPEPSLERAVDSPLGLGFLLELGSLSIPDESRPVAGGWFPVLRLCGADVPVEFDPGRLPILVELWAMVECVELSLGIRLSVGYLDKVDFVDVSLDVELRKSDPIDV